MPALKQDVTIWQGDTRTLVFDVKNKDGTIPSLSGARIRWWMGAKPPTSSVHIMKDNGTTGGVSLTSTAGEFVVYLVEADTLTLTPATYYHEAEVRLTDNTVATVAVGQFTIAAALIP
jgi:hypothetical protein